MTNENKKNIIIQQIENLSSSDLVILNNLYCEKNDYSDDTIYENDEDFFQTFFNSNIMEAVRAAQYGDFNYKHFYVKFNGYGNLKTLSHISLDDLAETVETIANYAIENNDDFDGLLNLNF